MHQYSFQRRADDAEFPIGECQSDNMALALLAKMTGEGKFSLVGTGEPVYLMKKSPDGWGRPNIGVYKAK